MPTLNTGYIRINLRGREPEGIVEPGREYEEAVDRIAADFAQLESPAPSQIRRVADIAGRVPESLPDLIVSW